MIIDASPRRSGKTTRVVEWVKAEKNRAMIVHSIDEKKRIIKEYGLTEDQVYTHNQIINSPYGLGAKISDFYIDNAEKVINKIFSDKVAGISVETEATKEDDEVCVDSGPVIPQEEILGGKSEDSTGDDNLSL